MMITARKEIGNEKEDEQALFEEKEHAPPPSFLMRMRLTGMSRALTYMMTLNRRILGCILIASLVGNFFLVPYIHLYFATTTFPDWAQESVEEMISAGGRAQGFPHIKTDKIKAYVLTMDTKTARYNQTSGILKRCGFYVIPVLPIKWNDSFINEVTWPMKKPIDKMIFSNRYTFRMVWDWINYDPTLGNMEVPFSLIFEDDININPQIKPEQVDGIARNAAKLSREAGYSGLFYLGMGLSSGYGNCEKKGTYEKTFDGISYNVCNGRLFHATGLLKYEGKWLGERTKELARLKYSDNVRAFMDAEVQLAFKYLNKKSWPYLAGWDIPSPKRSDYRQDMEIVKRRELMRRLLMELVTMFAMGGYFMPQDY
eukprot:TRINITY_DN4284_c0_g2_i3.p1 TRINITY_DN4284_c0_g2~~TRINITY_DN4284_c0_g2_i3.p1  ORF type:complete len:370 (-),score=99.44 TRINITY_DN4284_c0_g2_i3:411-1520(-)